jgi:SHS2 domain-containing protein
MERYKFLDHTADAKFQAFGKTLEEAFSNAALATAALMWDWEAIEKNVEHHVQLEGKDLKQLLCGFLEEIIYLLDSKMFLLGRAERVHIEQRKNKFLLKSLFMGDKYSDKYQIYGEVKAITYNEMRVERNRLFKVQVVVDM